MSESYYLDQLNSKHHYYQHIECLADHLSNFLLIPK